MRQMKFCPNCGLPVEKSNRFCISCGIKFDIFISQIPEESSQSGDYQYPTPQPTDTQNQSATDNQKAWTSEAQNWQRPDNTPQHDKNTTPDKGNKPSNQTITPIRSQIDKFLDDLFK